VKLVQGHRKIAGPRAAPRVRTPRGSNALGKEVARMTAHHEGVVSTETHRRRSEAARRRWQKRPYRDKVTEAIRARSKSLEYRKHLSDRACANWAKTEYQERQEKSRRRLSTNPEYQKRLREMGKKSGARWLGRVRPGMQVKGGQNPVSKWAIV
jgi:hypothetical protein